MIEVPSDPEPAHGDLAGLVDSIRRPAGAPRPSSWQPHTSKLPKAIERDVDAAVRDFLRPPGPAFFRFRKPAAALLVCCGTLDEEAAVVDRIVKTLDLRLFAFDLQDLRRFTLAEVDRMVAPIYDDRPAVVHFGRIDKFDPAKLEQILERRASAVFVIATAHGRDPDAAKFFKRKLVFER